jgi:hypothetical protein
VLEDRVLKEFLNHSMMKPAIIVNFDQIAVEIDYLDDRSPEEIHISMLGVKDGFCLRSAQREVLKMWLETLIINISESQGAKGDVPAVINEKNLRFPRISNSQFVSSASNGDLLLFTSKETTAKLQRKLTFSKYDHVALILRYSTGLIAILESTRDTGVQVLFWDIFLGMNWHNLYKRLVTRKLQGPKSTSFIESLHNFVSRVEGKKYSLSPSKLFSSSDDSFFCSELVAACYKSLSLLPSSSNTSSYFPVHFSEDKALSLEGDFSLGPECLIDFSL